MTDEHVTYRLPHATFPLHFEALGTPRVLELRFINGADCWRAMFDGFYLTSAKSEHALAELLKNEGVEIKRRSLVGTMFRTLEAQGVAERVKARE